MTQDHIPAASVRLRIAVVGGGISGLGAAWLLGKKHRVTLFEAGSYAGGHANTVEVNVDGIAHPVDTGFLVFNRRTYPNLCGLFSALDVPVAASNMSFSVSLAERDLEWSGTGLTAIFGQKSNLVRPAFWTMLRELLRFNRETTALALDHAAPDISLGDYLARNGYSAAFRDWYLLPMAAAIWSCPTAQMLAYPLSTFLRFCHNHGLLKIVDQPQWLTVRGGAREYVKRLLPGIPELRLNSPVRGVMREGTVVTLLTDAGAEPFDAVVFACHSDQTLRILGEGATPAECTVLGAVKYQSNRALLHTDPTLLPRREKVWAAWNYLAGEGTPDHRPVSVSYLLNKLQPLPFRSPVSVSLNPFREPAPHHLLGEFAYDHPVFDQGAIDAQAHLPALQGQQRTWFAGAWTGYGFHEDGLKSGVEVAAMLGVVAPWKARQLDLSGVRA